MTSYLLLSLSDFDDDFFTVIILNTKNGMHEIYGGFIFFLLSQ